MKVYPVEVWDYMELFGKAYNNHQLYCRMRMKTRVDDCRMQESLDQTIREFPILACSYKKGFYSSHWVDKNPESYVPIEILSFREEVDRDRLYERYYLKKEIDIYREIQIKVLLVRDAVCDELWIMMNHMVCDAQGMKLFLEHWCNNYNYVQSEVKQGINNRNPSSFYWRRIRESNDIREKVKLLFRFQSYRRIRPKMNFTRERGEPFIVEKRIEKGGFDRIQKYCKERGVTINDFMLTAYIWRLKNDADKSLIVPMMVDIRRYMTHENPGLANYVATLVVSDVLKEGGSFEDALMRIKADVRGQLRDFRAIDGYFYLIGTIRLLPIPLAKWLISQFFQSFPIAYSNLGILDMEKIRFGEEILETCYMTGSIKEKPCFWLDISTYDGVLSMTINLRGTEEDKRMIERWLDQMTEIVEKVVGNET